MRNDITVGEFREQKKKMESEIHNKIMEIINPLIREFKENTGVSVKKFEIDFLDITTRYDPSVRFVAGKVSISYSEELYD